MGLPDAKFTEPLNSIQSKFDDLTASLSGTPRFCFHRSTVARSRLASLFSMLLVGGGRDSTGGFHPGAAVTASADSGTATLEPKSSTRSDGLAVRAPKIAFDPSRNLPALRVTHDAVAVEAIDLMDAVIATMDGVVDKRSALALADSLKDYAGDAKSINERWRSLSKLNGSELLALRKRHADRLKSTGLAAGKSLLMLTARWKTKEIRAGLKTLVAVTKGVHGIVKELRLLD